MTFLVTTAAGPVAGSGVGTEVRTGAQAASQQVLTAYVVEKRRNRVVPIVVSTRAPGLPITVGLNPAGIAITPDARTAFVTNHGDGTVTPITLATRTPGTPIRVGANPSGIAISPDGTKAYVATGAGVVPVNVANRSAGSLIPVPGGAVGIALTPDGTTAFVTTDYPAYAVIPITLATRQRGPAISPAPNHPNGAMAITPNGRTLYVVTDSVECECEDTITPIDVASRTARTPIAGHDWGEALAIGPNGRTAYLGALDGVYFIDLTTGTTTGYVNGLLNIPNDGIAITPDGATGFVSDDVIDGRPEVTPFSTQTTKREASIRPVGPGPIAITPARAPVAALTVTARPHGVASHLDASASFARNGRIIYYYWYFGDGSKATTTVPTVDHVYGAAGSYTAKVVVADSNHTSNLQVFTGQTMSRNGGPSAKASRLVSVS